MAERTLVDWSVLCRRLALCTLLTAAGGVLASCDTPVGRVPGTSTFVTNPDGNGPQVVRWGPPEADVGGGG